MSIFDKTTQLGPHAIVAGFIGAAGGGVIRWVTLQESWRTGLATLVASGLFGGLAAPVFSPSLAASMDASVLVTTAFLALTLGIVGLTISKVLIEMMKTDTFLSLLAGFLTSAATSWLSRKTGVAIPPETPETPALPPPSDAPEPETPGANGGTAQ